MMAGVDDSPQPSKMPSISPGVGGRLVPWAYTTATNLGYRLHVVDVYFSTLTRSMPCHCRVAFMTEVKARILAQFDAIDRAPVIHR